MNEKKKKIIGTIIEDLGILCRKKRRHVMRLYHGSIL